MGVGVGGDYPLSAIITSEFAATRIRGRMMACVFSAQGYGQFLAALIGYISVMALKSDIINGPTTYDKVDLAWRILIGLGAVPGAIALYFRCAPDTFPSTLIHSFADFVLLHLIRLTISETPRYTLDVERNVAGAAA